MNSSSQQRSQSAEPLQVCKCSLRIGFLINPVAGLGGPAGLKGSDSLPTEMLEGSEGRATERARRCLELLLPQAKQLQFYCWGGAMGQVLLDSLGYSCEVLGQPLSSVSSAEDTLSACQALWDAGVDLLVFVGGDGTARNICEVVDTHLPVLGIPAGVKMQSGVFALVPEVAAEVITRMLEADLVDVRPQEVRDIDEAAYRQGVVRSRYFGEMLVPEIGQFVQATKQGGKEVEALVLDDIAAEVVDRMDDDSYYLIGPGTTPQSVSQFLGIEATLLGFDLVKAGQLLEKDLNGSRIETLVAEHPGRVVVVLTATGQQGSLLGRGNQQLTPSVLLAIGKENLWVVATKTKITGLQGRPLLIDTNDALLDQQLSGYYRVITGYRDEVLYPASCFYGPAAKLS